MKERLLIVSVLMLLSSVCLAQSYRPDYYPIDNGYRDHNGLRSPFQGRMQYDPSLYPPCHVFHKQKKEFSLSETARYLKDHEDMNSTRCEVKKLRRLKTTSECENGDVIKLKFVNACYKTELGIKKEKIKKLK